MVVSNPIPLGNTPPSWLRRNLVLVVLSASCLIMILLTFEQDRTIANQRDLIHSLFRDSIELNALKLQRQQASRHR